MAPPRRRPRPKISLWARFRTWLRYWESPLRIRSSITRLRHQHQHPILTLLRMFIPYPAWYFPVPGPFSPLQLINDEENKTGLIESQFGDIHNLRAIPVWRVRDTPLRCIYRLYELHLADRYALMGWETEYFFFRPDWKVSDIPDPRDLDPIRYAMLASLVEELHEAVNWRLGLGLRRNRKHIYRERNSDPLPSFTAEELPAWPKYVPAIDKALLTGTIPTRMLDLEGNLMLEQDGKGQNFARRNIVTNTGWFYTI